MCPESSTSHLDMKRRQHANLKPTRMEELPAINQTYILQQSKSSAFQKLVPQTRKTSDFEAAMVTDKCKENLGEFDESVVSFKGLVNERWSDCSEPDVEDNQHVKKYQLPNVKPVNQHHESQEPQKIEIKRSTTLNPSAQDSEKRELGTFSIMDVDLKDKCDFKDETMRGYIDERKIKYLTPVDCDNTSNELNIEDRNELLKLIRVPEEKVRDIEKTCNTGAGSSSPGMQAEDSSNKHTSRRIAEQGRQARNDHWFNTRQNRLLNSGRAKATHCDLQLSDRSGRVKVVQTSKPEREQHWFGPGHLSCRRCLPLANSGAHSNNVRSGKTQSQHLGVIPESRINKGRNPTVIRLVSGDGQTVGKCDSYGNEGSDDDEGSSHGISERCTNQEQFMQSEFKEMIVAPVVSRKRYFDTHRVEKYEGTVKDLSPSRRQKPKGVKDNGAELSSCDSVLIDIRKESRYDDPMYNESSTRWSSGASGYASSDDTSADEDGVKLMSPANQSQRASSGYSDNGLKKISSDPDTQMNRSRDNSLINTPKVKGQMMYSNRSVSEHKRQKQRLCLSDTKVQCGRLSDQDSKHVRIGDYLKIRCGTKRAMVNSVESESRSRPLAKMGNFNDSKRKLFKLQNDVLV